MNSHIEWNLSCDMVVRIGKELRRTLKKWDFCDVAEEEMVAYSVVDTQDNDSVYNIAYDILRLRRDGNCPCFYMYELKQQQNLRLFCLIFAVCAVEEDVSSSPNIKTPSIFYINQQGMAYCENCKISKHETVSNTAIIKVEIFENLACF